MYEYCFSEILIQLNYSISKVESCYDNSFKKLKLNIYNILLEE